MPKIFSIGKVKVHANEIGIYIWAKYTKGLKGVEDFSHINISCIDSENKLVFVTGKVTYFDETNGEIVLKNEGKLEPSELALIDIKPYLPSEDNAGDSSIGFDGNKMNERANGNLRVEKIDAEPKSMLGSDSNWYEIEYAGEIRNTHGVTYLQFDEGKMPKVFSRFENVIWWFDKFDNTNCRRVLQCDTPYECEGKLGVFACRAPVRPNPVATTLTKIEKLDFDNNRVYIRGIESFDHTPFFGIIDYLKDNFIDITKINLPEWASKWTNQIDVSDKSKKIESVNELVNNLDKNGAVGTELGAQFYVNQTRTHREKPTHILVKGARENNLKDISVSIPYGKITAVVGVSGSGKSSLVMDTVYAECRRRMEYLSSETSNHPRPEMDSMTGCMPTVMISQKEIRGRANSTIGTFSGINNHLRSIYAAIGKKQYTDENAVEFKLTPATFSFLDFECRCQACNGTGMKQVVDIDKVITHPKKSLLDGASPFFGKLRSFIENPNGNWMKGQAVALANEMGIDLETPWENLPEEYKRLVLEGDANRKVAYSYDNKKNGRTGTTEKILEGVIPAIIRLHVEDDKAGMSKKFMSEGLCDVCNGERLGIDGRLTTVLGIRFPVAASMSFENVAKFMIKLRDELPEEELVLVDEHIDAILELCVNANKLGIDYIELGRSTTTLSGGEAQRLKLLSAFANHMTGILYIFDEPSKKLSSKEYKYIIDMMKELIEDGNTILMVEHNMDMISIADYVIEIGPKAGSHGGYLMAEGAFKDVTKYNNTMLGKYVDDAYVFDRSNRPVVGLSDDKKKNATVSHVCANNLKDVTVSFPKKALTCITGVSGSGKSSLLYHGILPQMEKGKDFDQVVLVESKIQGTSSRSVVATYVGIMDDIRTIFASTDYAIENNLTEKDFSFNTGSLRCENCKGDGRIKIPFTDDVYSVCPHCKGTRYVKEVKKIKWMNKSISEVLLLSVDEAIEFFEGGCPSISLKCKLLKRVGLDYIKLGQSTSMLSGGEAARLKIASCLMDANMKNSLFLLDEPTCGLHFSDIDNLINLIFEIIDLGNTVVGIEHNKRFLSAADYTITMGPGAGKLGGTCMGDVAVTI